MRNKQMFLVFLLLICASFVLANAEARENELDETVQVDEALSSSEITFRGIPWGSTKQKTEEVLGKASNESTTVIYLTGITIDKDIGIGARYSLHPLTVAGYTAKKTKVSYVYPVIDGVMLRDNDRAILFFAGYEIMDDTNDANAIFEDLTEKLSKLYGEYVANDKDKSRIWTDALNNSVQLELFGNSVMVNYTYGMAEELVAEAQKARDEERAEQLEETKNNVDGL